MKKYLWVIFLLFLSLIVGIVIVKTNQTKIDNTSTPVNSYQKEEKMKIITNDFSEGELIPPEFTCDGENLAPLLHFEEIPAGAETLALVVDDPDAPGGDFTHWLVWNIPVNTTDLNEKSMPYGVVVGVNDFGDNGYGGPCPPSGIHRYQFTLYALDTTLNIPIQSRKEDVQQATGSHVLESANLIGLYQR